MSICSNCGNNLSSDSIFCNKCGTKVVKEIFCNKCGNKLNSDSNFCNKCGTKVNSKLDCENTFTDNSTVTNNPFANINAQPINPFNDIPQPTKANLPNWNNPFANTSSNANTNSNINFSGYNQEMSDFHNTYEDIKRIVIDRLLVDADLVTMEARFIDDLGADSLDAIELAMAFEEYFGIEIPDEEARNIKTVGDAVKYINEKK